MVALAAASAEPGLVKALVLEDPPFSTMGERLLSLPLLRYFQGVEACLDARQSADPQTMYEAFSHIVVGTADDGSPILVKDQRDETSRRYSAECLTRIDPAVMKPITSGRWLEGYELERIVERVRCPVELLQADAQCGGMLTDAEAQLVLQKLPDQCRLRFFAKTGHSIHWAQPDEVIASVRRLVG
jgi:pimeloyl-ACP methyl ester carboxylesterase